MRKKLIGYILFFIALILVFWYLIFKDTDVLTHSTLLNRSRVAPFSFINQNGLAVSNLDMQHKVCVINYFFTTCKSICPPMNHNMQRVYDAFKNNPDVLIISHTCKPETDSIPKLKHYSDSLGINPLKWMFVTGSKDSLYRMARVSYGIDDPKDVIQKIEDDFIHTQFFALVDKNGMVRGGVYDGLQDDEIEKLIKDIKGLLKEGNSQFTGQFAN